LINPTAVTYSNTFAGQLVALNLNITFDAYDPNFAPSGVLFRDMIIASGPFVGLTVQQLYNQANTAIGCGGSKTYISDLTTALDLINNSWRDGIKRNNYLICPVTPPSVRLMDKNDPPVAYPNPTSDLIRIKYDLTESHGVSLIIFNMTGQVVYREHHDFGSAGEQVMELQLVQKGLTPGIYLVRSEFDGGVYDLRIILTE
jgi:hypothetical protein